MSSMLLAGGLMLILSCVVCAVLSAAHARWAVTEDPRQAQLLALLPMANCGGCGFPGCAQYARAILENRAGVDLCTVGGSRVTQALAGLIGVSVIPNAPWRPVIHCSAKRSDRLKQGHYTGLPSCAAASVVGGVQGCTWGCLGFGDCVQACDFDAMKMSDGLPVIDYDRCTGCGACVTACPRGIIERVPFKADRVLVVGCSNHDPGKAVREVCNVGCIGCSACARMMPDLIQLGDHLVSVDYEKITGHEDFGAVQAKCPMQSLVVMGKPLPEHAELLNNEFLPEVIHPVNRDDGREHTNWRG